MGLNLLAEKTRKHAFLGAMDRVVSWSALAPIVEPRSPRAKTGRPPFVIETTPRTHCLQQRLGPSDPSMDEALHDAPWHREFVGLGDD